MAAIDKLIEVMAQLRGPKGCPWDKEQTHETIKSQLIEESYEVLEAIDSKNPKALKEELGDLLLHVVFHTQLEAEKKEFNFDDVAQGIVDKLIRRHPHVFGDTSVSSSGEVLKNWQDIKKTEKPERKNILDGIPNHLPALMKAQELQKKASHVGFDWPDREGPLKKVEEEIEEVKKDLDVKDRAAEEIGDLLFAVVNLTRHLKLDAEECLMQANTKFKKRFEAIETKLTKEGKKFEDCSLEELDKIWNEVKKGS
jgi:tetrapyrrole methylase family protein/MazG family protein